MARLTVWGATRAAAALCAALLAASQGAAACPDPAAAV